MVFGELPAATDVELVAPWGQEVGQHFTIPDLLAEYSTILLILEAACMHDLSLNVLFHLVLQMQPFEEAL
jgi:hypothetical protein